MPTEPRKFQRALFGIFIVNLSTWQVSLSAIVDKRAPSVVASCPSQQFYSRIYKSCVPCSNCDQLSVMAAPCSTSSDSVCKRCTDGAYQMDLMHPSCRKCPPCPPGSYVTSPCTADKPTECSPCPAGSYSPGASYRQHCFPCDTCENRETVVQCNARNNSVCGACKKGYYRDENQDICRRCYPCEPGQSPLVGCMNGISGRECGVYVRLRTDYLYFMDPVEELSTPTTTTGVPNERRSSRLLVIIGVCVGSLVGFLVVCAVIIIPFRKLHRSKCNTPGHLIENVSHGSHQRLKEESVDNDKCVSTLLLYSVQPDRGTEKDRAFHSNFDNSIEGVDYAESGKTRSIENCRNGSFSKNSRK